MKGHLTSSLYDPLTKKSGYYRVRCTQFIQEMADNLPPTTIVLDLGCGGFDYRQLFHRQRYIGLDINPKYPDLDCIGDVNKLPFADQSIDTVLANNLLEHVNTPHLLLAEVYRVLKPGGKLYLLVPFFTHIHQAPIDFFRYTKYGLASLFEKAGLTPLSLESVGGLFAIQSYLINVCFRRIFEMLSQKRGGRVLVTLLRPVWSRCYYHLLLPLLSRLDRWDPHDDYALGYFSVQQKSAECGSPAVASDRERTLTSVHSTASAVL